MNDDINKKLLDNPFSKKVMDDLYASIKSLQQKKGYSLSENNHHLLSEKEKYISRISKLHNDIIENIEQIEFIRIFIRRFPLKQYYGENNIDNLNYIQYHIESLFYRVHTVQEIMKLLVNEIYSLGLIPKKCTWNILTKKLSKQNLSLIIIDKYFEVFENMIEGRHLKSHRGIFNDKDIDEINLDFGYSIYKMHKQLNINTPDDFKIDYPEYLINFKIKNYKKKRIELIEKVQFWIYKLTNDFLVSLLETYLEKTK